MPHVYAIRPKIGEKFRTATMLLLNIAKKLRNFAFGFIL